MAALAATVTRGDRWGWLDPKTLAALAIALSAGPFLVHRARTRLGTPLDVDLFRVRSYAAANGVSFLSQAAFFAFFFSIPLFLIEVWHWSILKAGFAIALNQLSAAVVGLSAGRWADRNGHSGVIIAGGVVAGIGYGWLAFAADAEPQLWAVMVPSFVVGGVGSMLDWQHDLGGRLSPTSTTVGWVGLRARTTSPAVWARPPVRSRRSPSSATDSVSMRSIGSGFLRLFDRAVLPGLGHGDALHTRSCASDAFINGVGGPRGWV